MITLGISNIKDKCKKELKNNVKDEPIEYNPYFRFNLKYPENAIFPPMNNWGP